MKKILYTDFEGMDSLIETMLSSKELKKAVTRNNMYKFWSKIVGKKFSEKSRPFSMAANGVLVIACQSPAVAQELMFQKAKILTEFQPYMKSLHITVKDIRFDCKKWVTEEE